MSRQQGLSPDRILRHSAPREGPRVGNCARNYLILCIGTVGTLGAIAHGMVLALIASGVLASWIVAAVCGAKQGIADVQEGRK